MGFVEGRGKKEEGRRKKEKGRRKKEKGRRKRAEDFSLSPSPSAPDSLASNF
ncbi:MULTISPECIES: hypothetical protein [unclassified Microcoleus]|uniref:hypothetical protein n=1 Tax=unclassified Microcoleus TaxID=2642155 RepID=UPI001E091818|nr:MULTISPECIES: hypothetical protein [unclassified Microcoleus]MCC3483581.1 hypothetical protein [Microcoleus sp. PH2017_14_LAR_D_A]MCC3565462.1 hypothetical protein [Microcoleus sp. PH2017_31_RDM_U_A]